MRGTYTILVEIFLWLSIGRRQSRHCPTYAFNAEHVLRNYIFCRGAACPLRQITTRQAKINKQTNTKHMGFIKPKISSATPSVVSEPATVSETNVSDTENAAHQSNSRRKGLISTLLSRQKDATSSKSTLG